MCFIGLTTDKNISHSFNKGNVRGPDYTNIIETDEYTACFHRLAITGSSKGIQPFKHDDIILMCNGEIYNHKQLEIDYKIKTKSRSDCECLLPLYLKFGNNFIHKLDGEFAIIIYDKKVKVFRDHYGIRPLYWNKSKTAFASTLNAISNFDDVTQFPPGHYWTGKKLVKYHKPSRKVKQRPLEECHKQIKMRLFSVIKKRTMSNKNIRFASLIGGVDSSLITSIAHRYMKDRLTAFTVTIDGYSTDLKLAQSLCDKQGIELRVINITKQQALEGLSETVRVSGTFDVTTIRASTMQRLVCREIAKQGFKVVLCGDGVDEFAFSYMYYKNCPSNCAFHKESIRLLEEIHLYDGLRSDRNCSHYGLEMRMPYLDPEFCDYYIQCPIEYRNDKTIEKKLFRDSFKDIIPDENLYKMKEALSDTTTRKEDSFHSMIAYRFKQYVSHQNEYEGVQPISNEAKYYRDVFEQEFGYHPVIDKYWMPRWSNVNDPSARDL